MMISNGTDYHIKMAVSEECAAAIDKHGEFNSHHEAFAVLQEECEEVVEAVQKFVKTYTQYGKTVETAGMPNLWHFVRKDNTRKIHKELSVKIINNIKNRALEIAQEGVQVAAVCDKWILLLNKECEEVE